MTEFRYDINKPISNEDLILQSFRSYDNGETRYYVQGAFTMTHGDAKQFREELIEAYNSFRNRNTKEKDGQP